MTPVSEQYRCQAHRPVGVSERESLTQQGFPAIPAEDCLVEWAMSSDGKPLLIRVPARVVRAVLESNAAVNPNDGDKDALALVDVLCKAARRKDGSVRVELYGLQRVALKEY